MLITPLLCACATCMQQSLSQQAASPCAELTSNSWQQVYDYPPKCWVLGMVKET